MSVNGAIKSLLQGISQQEPRDRLTGQHTKQDNMYVDPVTGLTRRPGSDFISRIAHNAAIRGWHNFRTRDGGKWIMTVNTLGEVTVFNQAGVSQTIDRGTADVKSYLATGGDTDELRFTTLDNDETYIVNPRVKVAMEASVWNLYDPKKYAVVWVTGGAYSRNFKIFDKGVRVAAFATPDGQSGHHYDWVTISAIMKNVVGPNPAIADWPDPADRNMALNQTVYDYWVFENYCVIRRKDGGDVDITVHDDESGQLFNSMGGAVDSIDELPERAPHNWTVRIAENADPQEDVYYRFIADGKTPADHTFNPVVIEAGYWQETVAFGTSNVIDPKTMPKLIKYDAFGVFRVVEGTWEGRKVGTNTSNEEPSFVGQTINDITSFQGRLTCLSGAGLVMSRTNRYNDFWKGSIASESDTDRIDIRSRLEASVMRAAVQYNKDLVIFSDTAQFLLKGDNAITPSNAALPVTSSFESDLSAQPVASGKNIFYATKFGSYTNMQEFFVDGNTNVNDSRPILQHAKRYVPGTVTHIASSDNYGILAITADGAPNDIFIYQYIWAENEKLQSAWHRWRFQKKIAFYYFDREELYIICEDQLIDNYIIHRISLDILANAGAGYTVHLDARFDVQGVNTQFLAPDTLYSASNMVAVQSTGCPNPGMTVPIKNVLGRTVTLSQDMQGGDIVVGIPYLSEFIPTSPMVKDRDGVPINTGVLKVKNFEVTLRDTGDATARSLSKFDNSVGTAVDFSPRKVGFPSATIGAPSVINGKFLIPFRQNMENADLSIYTSSHLPMNIVDIEWNGTFSSKGRRITTGE